MNPSKYIAIAGLCLALTGCGNAELVTTVTPPKNNQSTDSLMSFVALAPQSSDDALLLDVLQEYFAPFGLYDPVTEQTATASLPEGLTASDVANLEYGFLMAAQGYSETTTYDLIDQKLKIIGEFDASSFWRDYNLLALQQGFEQLPDTTLVAYWPNSRAKRHNQWFITEEKGVWSWDRTGSTVNFERTEQAELTTVPVADEFWQSLNDHRIQTIYACNGETIYIISGLVDNMHGLIYQPNADQLNCGLLQERFELERWEQVADQWYYFSAS